MRWFLFLGCMLGLAAGPDIAGAIRDAMARGDYAAAAGLYPKLIAAGQDSPELRSNYGVALHMAGRNREALEQFRAALRGKPDLTAANLFAGVALVDLGRPREALPYLERARSLDAAGAAPLVALGNAYVALRDFPAANTAYAEAVKREPNLAEAWYGLGITCRSLAERQLSRGARSAESRRLLDRSLAALTRAVALDPNSPRAHLILGESLRDSGKLADAVPEYRAAIRLAPQMEAAYLGLATTYWKRGDFDEALPQLDRALELSPRDPEANAIYADILEHRSDPVEAEKHAALALAANPHLAVARVVLARIALARRQPEEALRQLQPVVNADPDGSYHFLLWRTFKLLGKPDEAEAALAEFRRLRGNRQ